MFFGGHKKGIRIKTIEKRPETRRAARSKNKRLLYARSGANKPTEQQATNATRARSLFCCVTFLLAEKQTDATI